MASRRTLALLVALVLLAGAARAEPRALAELASIIRDTATEPATTTVVRFAALPDCELGRDELASLGRTTGLGADPVARAILSRLVKLTKRDDLVTLTCDGDQAIALGKSSTKATLHLSARASFRVRATRAAPDRVVGTLDEVEGIKVTRGVGVRVKRLVVTREGTKQWLDVGAALGPFSVTKVRIELEDVVEPAASAGFARAVNPGR